MKQITLDIICQYATRTIKDPDGILFEASEPCCQHENFPWVEFPRGSGNRDPLYCRVARVGGVCPMGCGYE
jgi:hypothetical protein